MNISYNVDRVRQGIRPDLGGGVDSYVNSESARGLFVVNVEVVKVIIPWNRLSKKDRLSVKE